MPYPEKSRQKHTFTDGQNSDLAREIFPTTMARYILNCHIRSTNSGNEGIVTNPKGNLMISTPLPSGNNKCIGTAVAVEKGKFYFFVYNDEGKHSIFEYNEITNTVSSILESTTDTGGVDILKFSKDWLILHADYVDGKLYWVDGLNPARKTNIARLIDKSPSGYGTTVQESFIDAYMRTAIYAPTAKYITDLTKPYNKVYGMITKYAQRFRYMDSEYSSVSDFSAVAIPDKEPTQGFNNIPTDNNGIEITVETGSHDVKDIEILMQSTIADIDDVEGTLNWKLIVTLNKKKLGIPDNGTYTYRFFNDRNYATVAASDVIQAQSFMMDRPLCQTVAKNVLTYSNGYVGFPVVEINASVEIIYSELFVENDVENEFNEPAFIYGATEADYVKNGGVIKYDGTIENVISIGSKANGPKRFQKQTLTIGFDVKKGNVFKYYAANGYGPDTIDISYTANVTDTATTVANAIKNMLIATGRIYKKTPDVAEQNIYNNTLDGDGNLTFSFMLSSSRDKNYMNGSTFVNPVQFNTLKDLGVSVKAEKMGTRKKLYYEYIKFNGQKSAAYTDDNLLEIVQSENVDGKKAVTIRLTTNHLPPIEAEYFQILRSEDLNSVDFIQLLIQKVVDVPTDNTSEYLDLVVGSFYTYKKLHPNSTVNFDFAKGDIVSLKKKADDSYYPYFETEVLEYNEIVTDRVRDNIVTNGTATITVTAASEKNIGKFISVDGWEREITAASLTTYTLNNVVGDATPKTYLYYDLIDRRGTIRIKKPSPSIVVIEDESLVEIYKPSRTSETDETAFEFQQKFPIINAGTANAYHSGNVQNQSASQPSIIDINAGSIYVRSREMPLNNSFPGTQVKILLIEDPNFSDFYNSRMNDNGRVNSLDKGQGVVHVADRVQFSLNYLEGNLINGFNNFKNLNRRDYNDDFGDIKLTKYDNERLVIYKELRTRWVPLNAVLTQQTNGTSLLVSSDQFLNDINSYAWEGGIGNNPESWASNGTHRYYVSANSGVIIRFGGNGEEPISDTFNLDSESRTLLSEAAKNKAKIFGVFDREYGYYIISFEAYEKYIFFDGFSTWVVDNQPLADDVVFEVVTAPSHGDFDLGTITYTPDEDYVGNDTFSYRAFIGGEWTQPRNVCITIIEEGNTQTAWRGKGEGTCILDGDGLRTGFKAWEILEQFYIFTGIATGTEKPNSIIDVDYIAPIFDTEACSIEFGNDYQSQEFFSEECPEGEEPLPYLYEVQPNEFIASTKEAANALALADIAENGQDDANEFGTCEVIPDPTPDPYYFVDITDATTATEYISNMVTISGLVGSAPVSVTPGKDYRKNGGAWTSADGTAVNGDTFELRLTSSNDYDTEVNSTLTIGGYSDTYNVTTEEIPVIACGVDASFSGGESFPSEYIITLGTDTGTVVLDFDAASVPDKFIVIFDGVEVINTGYRGDISQQSSLDAALAARSLPPEPIVGVGSGVTFFNKTTATTTAIVRVYAPISGTAWNFRLECPADDVFTLINTSYGLSGVDVDESCIGDTETENIYKIGTDPLFVGMTIYKEDGSGGYEPLGYTPPIEIGDDPLYYWVSFVEGSDRKWLKLDENSNIVDQGFCGYGLVATEYAVGMSDSDSCLATLDPQPNALYTDNPSGTLEIGDIPYIESGGIGPYIPLDEDDLSISYMEGSTRVWILLDVTSTIINKGNC